MIASCDIAVNMSYGLTPSRAGGIVCITCLGGQNGFFQRSQPDSIIANVDSRPIVLFCFSTGLVSRHVWRSILHRHPAR
jgi:hypothetical protein